MTELVEGVEKENPDDLLLKKFTATDDTTIQQILISLISDKKNLTLKTEIQNPKGLASLYTLKEYFISIECPITAKIINSFIDIYLEYMVSNKRRSRKEVIHAISHLSEFSENINNELGTTVK